MTPPAAPTAPAAGAPRSTGPEIDPGGGTAEAAWQAWAGLAELPPFRLPVTIALPPPADVVVVAPHPDDEVLGVGGLARQVRALGARVRIVVVTDGEASHPRSRAITSAALRRARIDESVAALDVLGLGSSPIHRLGLPDGAVGDREAELAERVAELISPTSIVLGPWCEDGHPDHDAVGRAVARAAATIGAGLVEYPIWMWNWAAPGDPRVPWCRARRIPLGAHDVAAKAAAIATYRTQVTALGPEPDDGPVLPAATVAHHLRPFEVVFT